MNVRVHVISDIYFIIYDITVKWFCNLISIHILIDPI